MYKRQRLSRRQGFGFEAMVAAVLDDIEITIRPAVEFWADLYFRKLRCEEVVDNPVTQNSNGNLASMCDNSDSESNDDELVSASELGFPITQRRDDHKSTSASILLSNMAPPPPMFHVETAESVVSLNSRTLVQDNDTSEVTGVSVFLLSPPQLKGANLK